MEMNQAPLFLTEQLLSHLYFCNKILERYTKDNPLSEDSRIARIRLCEVIHSLHLDRQFSELEERCNQSGLDNFSGPTRL